MRFEPRFDDFGGALGIGAAGKLNADSLQRLVFAVEFISVEQKAFL